MDVKHKIDRLARDSRAPEREKLIDGIRSQCGMPRAEKKKRRLTSNKLVALVSCCAAAACAAVVIPCVLLLGGDKDRYCVASEIIQQPLLYNIKQYNELHGTSILYLDWYEESNINYTFEIKLQKNNENIGISEALMNLSTSDAVKIQLTKKNIHIDYLDKIENLCRSKTTVEKTTVKWVHLNDDLSAVFVNGEYRYYVTLDNSTDETRFFEILTELLEEK